MEKRTFLTVAICILIFLGWQRFYIKPIVDAQNAHRAAQKELGLQGFAQEAGGVASKASPSAAGIVAPNLAPGLVSKPRGSAQPKELVLNQEAPRIMLSTQGAAISRFDVDHHGGKKLERIVEMISGPSLAEVSFLADGGQRIGGFIYDVKSSKDGVITLAYEDEKASITRTFSFDNNRFFVEIENKIQAKPASGLRFALVSLRAKKDIGKLENERRELIYSHGNKRDSFAIEDITERKEDGADTDWIAFASRYFLGALTHLEGNKPQFYAEAGSDGMAVGSLIYRLTDSELTFKNRLFIGPKDVDLLNGVGSKLSTAVDFGWFTFFAYPLLQGLKWLNDYVHNFGIAIILLTILVKLALYPLTYKSMKSMKEMQRIQPQIQKLRDKHGDNKEQLNKEMLQLMRSNGYNPLSGCLPVLVQMPIFIALYNVLYNSIELYGQPFFGWITDLSQKDPYFVTPVLLALVMFVQQKMTPTTTMDPAQQRMMNMMPVIFGAMMLWLPAGLTLYMLVNSVVSIAQQVVINKSFARAGLS